MGVHAKLSGNALIVTEVLRIKQRSGLHSERELRWRSMRERALYSGNTLIATEVFRICTMMVSCGSFRLTLCGGCAQTPDWLSVHVRIKADDHCQCNRGQSVATAQTFLEAESLQNGWHNIKRGCPSLPLLLQMLAPLPTRSIISPTRPHHQPGRWSPPRR